MNWEDFLKEFSARPLFHSSMLRIFDDPLAHIEVQLSRWSRAGKLVRIRRGWYLIEKPYRVRDVSEAVIANTVVQPSYLSLEWALGFYGLIPEAVFNPTSITTTRGVEFTARDRRYFYHHVRPSFFSGYEKAERGGDVFIIAVPEKALIDRIYISMRLGKFSEKWLKGLRLQNLDILEEEKLRRLAAPVGKPGFAAAVDVAAACVRASKKR
jgi:predicted transcriptional regulator of viral defense system